MELRLMKLSGYFTIEQYPNMSKRCGAVAVNI